MTGRKRSRAAASSRAGPSSVSMNPISVASGVRSSWLALATKSARRAEAAGQPARRRLRPAVRAGGEGGRAACPGAPGR
jgi:hypothetical protein